MAVYLTGDTHGTITFDKVAEFDADGLTRDDFLVILGDFGLVWAPECDYDPVSPEMFNERQEDERWLDWLEARPYTTLFVDGNHENFDLLAEYPVSEWQGGRVHVIRPHVLHLMRGEVFEIGGETFFAMGGAHSVDRSFRAPHLTWWPQESPDADERAYAEEMLAACGWKVDYVLTHAAPSEALCHITPHWPHRFRTDEYTKWLQSLADRLEYKRWFHGHYHLDVESYGERMTCLFNQVVRLDEVGGSVFEEG